MLSAHSVPSVKMFEQSLSHHGLERGFSKWLQFSFVSHLILTVSDTSSTYLCIDGITDCDFYGLIIMSLFRHSRCALAFGEEHYQSDI